MSKLKEGYAKGIVKKIKQSFGKWTNREQAEFYSNF